jgi:hypothetical protein
VINGARHTLRVENEEMDDSDVTAALEAAAKRGVDVEVVMTADTEWDDAFSQLESAGAHVRTYPDTSKAMYIHAKAVVADAGYSDQNLFVGSENFSEASLDENRELGIRTADTSVVSTISTTVGNDYNGASDSPGSRSSSGPGRESSGGGSSGGGSSGGGSSGGGSSGGGSSGSSSTALCGAPGNPFGLTLCGGGEKVTSPPPGVCGYFRCISSFNDGKGYMVECQDGAYSMSGGREGACDGHGGPGRPVTTTR